MSYLLKKENKRGKVTCRVVSQSVKLYHEETLQIENFQIKWTVSTEICVKAPNVVLDIPILNKVLHSW